MNKIWYKNHPLKYAFLPITAVFYLLVQLRLVLFRFNLISKKTSKTPVIVIGNISVGGTGKTPFIIYLATQLKKADIKVAIVSRGYGRQGKQEIAVLDSANNSYMSSKGATLEYGDEPVLIVTKTACPVIISSDRAGACAKVDEDYSVDLILSDDGMQHYKMARAKEWCLVDKQRGFGNNWLLPAGPLREPKSRLKTVNQVITQNTNTQFAADEKAFCLAVSEAYLLNNNCTKKALIDFKNDDCIAVAGIANPTRFFKSLIDIGLKITKMPFDDHHEFKQSDFESFDKTKTLFMTEKDAIKCSHFDLPNAWVVPVDVHTSAKLKQTIKKLIDDIQQKRLTNG